MQIISNKEQLLHRNYKTNFDRFKSAKNNGYQIEALLVIFAVFEQVLSNMIVRISSIDNECYLFIKKELRINSKKTKIFITLHKKIELIRSFMKKNENIVLNIIGKDSKLNELSSSLKKLNDIRIYRNDIVHDLMLRNVDYDEIESINDECVKIYRVLNKTASSIKRFISKNNIDRDVSDISNLLDQTVTD